MSIQTLSGELYNKEEVETIKTELNEKISEIIITGGGVPETTFEETVARLDETDNKINTDILSLQEADTAITERVIALENKDLTIEDNITALQEADTAITERVTALEAGVDVLEYTYTFIVDSQEAFDQLYNDSNATSPVETDYSSVLIKYGTYETHIGNGLRLDNENCPIGQIIGEANENGALPVVNFYTQYGFYCNNSNDQITRRISNITFQNLGSICIYMFYNVHNINSCTFLTLYKSNASPKVQSYCIYNGGIVINCTFTNVKEDDLTEIGNYTTLLYNTSALDCVCMLYCKYDVGSDNNILGNISEPITCTNCYFKDLSDESAALALRIKDVNNVTFDNCTFVLPAETVRTISAIGVTFNSCIFEVTAIKNTSFKSCTLNTCKIGSTDQPITIEASNTPFENCKLNACTFNTIDIQEKPTETDPTVFASSCELYNMELDIVWHRKLTSIKNIFLQGKIQNSKITVNIQAQTKTDAVDGPAAAITNMSAVFNNVSLHTVDVLYFYPNNHFAYSEDKDNYSYTSIYYNCNDVVKCSCTCTNIPNGPQDRNVFAYYNCTNLIDCTANVEAKCMFYKCSNLIRCFANQKCATIRYTQTSNNNFTIHDQHDYFNDCTVLTDCTAYIDVSATAPAKARANIIEYVSGFDKCSKLVNCNVVLKEYSTYHRNNEADATTLHLNAFNACTNLVSCAHVLDSTQKNGLIQLPYMSSNYSGLPGFILREGSNTPQDCKIRYVCFNNCINITDYSSKYFTASASPNTDTVNIYVYDLIIKKASDMSASISLDYTLFQNCQNIQNVVLSHKTASYNANGDSNLNNDAGHDYYGIDVYKVELLLTSSITVTQSIAFKQCKGMQNVVSLQYTTSTFCNGMHNCIGNFDTATCSASQDYTADYAVADTPAGGFNKIVA